MGKSREQNRPVPVESHVTERNAIVDAEIQRKQAMVAEDMTFKQIAALLNICRMTVSNYIDKGKCFRRGKGWIVPRDVAMAFVASHVAKPFRTAPATPKRRLKPVVRFTIPKPHYGPQFPGPALVFRSSPHFAIPKTKTA